MAKKTFDVGDRVKVEFEDGWYKGNVSEVRGPAGRPEEVRVAFDDGEVHNCEPDEVVKV